MAFLSSCAYIVGQDVTSMEAYQRAVEEGIILPIEELELEERVRNLVSVEVGEIHKVEYIALRFDMDQVRYLSFEQEEVRLLEILVSLNQVVTQGDVLAVATFDTREIEEEIEVLYLTIEAGERDLMLGWEQHQNLLHEMRVALDAMIDGYERQTQNQRIARQELIARNFYSQVEQRLEAYHEQLIRLYEQLEGDKIVAPFDGAIVWITEEEVDTVMGRQEEVLGIIDPESFQLWAEGRIELIRYGDVFPASMPRHDLEFMVEVVSDPIAIGTRQDAYKFILQPENREELWESIYELGIEYSVLRGLRLEGSPTEFVIKNVLVLPREAMNVHDDERYVWLYEDGEFRIRFVDTGFEDGSYVQILSGLKEGQRVVR